MNFIIKLLSLREKIIKVIYNFILIIINKLIKYKYFLLYKKATFIEDLIYMFLRIIVVNYKLLNKIILNRNKLFTLKF